MKLTVKLSHARNPDIAGGYWQPPVDSGRAKLLPISSIFDAPHVALEYIKRNGLGSGNWTGGEIREDGKPIGRVSYNGRLWDSSGKEIEQAGVKTVADCIRDNWK